MQAEAVHATCRCRRSHSTLARETGMDEPVVLIPAQGNGTHLTGNSSKWMSQQSLHDSLQVWGASEGPPETVEGFTRCSKAAAGFSHAAQRLSMQLHVALRDVLW